MLAEMFGSQTLQTMSWVELAELIAPTAKSEDLKAVVKILTDDGGLTLPNPDATDGLTAVDIDEIGKTVDVWVQRALMKKLVRAAVARLTGPGDGGLSSDSSLASPIKDRSTLEQLRLTDVVPMVPQPKKAVDISLLLGAAGVQGTPQIGLAPAAVFERLAEAADTAKRNGKTPYTFVELTSRDILPEWIHPEAVGGKLPVPCENEDLATGTLAQVATALKAATTAPRFFRTYQQWLGAWNRYGVAAISTKHMCIVSVLGHAQTIARISEERRGVEHHHVALSVQYDELRRRNWEARAARGDPDLNIRRESWAIDRELLDLAKARLETVVLNAGMATRRKESQSPSSQVTSESALAKQAAAIEAATKKAEATINRLSNATQNSHSGGFGGGNGGFGGGKQGYGKNAKGKGAGKDWNSYMYQPYPKGGHGKGRK